MRPPEIPRRDEEPEDNYHWIDSEIYRTSCAFCGHDDHKTPACPVRPI